MRWIGVIQKKYMSIGLFFLQSKKQTSCRHVNVNGGIRNRIYNEKTMINGLKWHKKTPSKPRSHFILHASSKPTCFFLLIHQPLADSIKVQCFDLFSLWCTSNPLNEFASKILHSLHHLPSFKNHSNICKIKRTGTPIHIFWPIHIFNSTCVWNGLSTRFDHISSQFLLDIVRWVKNNPKPSLSFETFEISKELSSISEMLTLSFFVIKMKNCALRMLHHKFT